MRTCQHACLSCCCALLSCVYCRDFISWGYKPHLEVLDRLLSCLRLQLPKPPQRPAAELQQRAMQLQAQLQALPHPDAPGDGPLPGYGGAPQQQQPGAAAGLGSAQDGQQQQGQWLATAALLRDLANQRRALSAEERPYEVPFDKRAIDAVADAISMGILPGLKVRLPLTAALLLPVLAPCTCCLVSTERAVTVAWEVLMVLSPLLPGSQPLTRVWLTKQHVSTGNHCRLFQGMDCVQVC